MWPVRGKALWQCFIKKPDLRLTCWSLLPVIHTRQPQIAINGSSFSVALYNLL
jgi:hypothetical protein